jgi:DNA glycosylase AlkZ-like
VAQLPVTDAAIAKARAAAQRLSAPASGTPAALVAWLGAVQSQDYPLATWSIAQRLAKTNTDVDAAIADGSILRTHVLRPTWHFVARDDLRWMQALTGPRVLARMSGIDLRNGLDAPLIVRATSAIAAAIARRGHLTRRDVADALTRAGMKMTPWLVGHLLMHAELRTIVCSGMPRGRQQTYALVDERAPHRDTMTRDDMLAALARRYFQSHGPATARDYQWWSWLSGADVKRSVEMLGRDVDRVRHGDRTYLAIHAQRAARPRRAAAHLVQPFDELVVAYSESRAVVDVSGAARAGGQGGAALLTRGVIYDGQMVARWTIAPASGSRAIALQPLRRLSSTERDAVQAAAARFERFYFRASRGSH